MEVIGLRKQQDGNGMAVRHSRHLEATPYRYRCHAPCVAAVDRLALISGAFAHARA